MKLKEITQDKLVTLHYTDSLNKAIALMEKHDIHHLPVVNGAMPIGMISDRDLLADVGWLSSRERIAGCEKAGVIGPTRVTDVMSRPIHALHPDDAVQDGARLLLKERINSVLLVADDKLVAIVTEKDYLRCYFDDHFSIPGVSWRFDKVSDHMRTHLLTCTPSDTLGAAAEIMYEKKVRHVVITEEDKPIGIVSDRDIRKALFLEMFDSEVDADYNGHRLKSRRLRDIMTDVLETTFLSATLGESAEQMLAHNIGALLVINDDCLAGIITETDLLMNFVKACEAVIQKPPKLKSLDIA
jgi:CBS domain-containing protein